MKSQVATTKFGQKDDFDPRKKRGQSFDPILVATISTSVHFPEEPPDLSSLLSLLNEEPYFTSLLHT